MLKEISWMEFIKPIALVVTVYYLAIVWVYRKELLQWWKARRK